ncbi:glycoside hydrolase family 78 protein [Halosquirtibacter laminarini]|uniref:Glycoside hydrolase family 78 protein n=1 Tax=Halosquirtibacter laminarini TaxID=3374600 RepID=A0AC61NIN0_9BACT|nr:glycoside hydrolase family 78 protein [Prolixibacteraceae bacterium]
MNIKKTRKFILSFLLIFSFSIPICIADRIQVIDTKTDGQRDPVGIDSTAPIFSWKMRSKQRGKKQQGYQIQVRSAEDEILWDSGKVLSDNNIRVKYNGLNLRYNHQYCWRVRVWDNDNKKSSWSKYSYFHTGIMMESQWKAKWITTKQNIYSPIYLKTFDLVSIPQNAFCYVNCQGFFELYINGQKVGDDVLSPAVSDYRYENYYLTYDIGKYLKKGENTIGIWTGRGWYSKGLPDVNYSSAMFRLQAHLSTSDREMLILSNEDWKYSKSNLQSIGAWRWNNMGGEVLDDRISMSKWTERAQDFQWHAVRVVPSSDALTTSQACPRNIKTDRIKAIDVTPIKKGIWLIDFGKNFTGWMKMKIKNQSVGDTIDFIYSDYCDQTPTQVSKYRWDFGIKNIPQRDAYICSNREEGEFCSKFNYHAFRYVVVQGLLYKPNVSDFEGIMIESDLDKIGDFDSSDSDLNAIYRLNRFTYRCLDNGGYFVDCPHRERLGYGGDGQVAIETGTYSFDTYNFYKKWARNWLDNQQSNGDFKHTAPSPYEAGGGPAWGGMGVVLPWKIYRNYGDTLFLKNAFPSMCKYVSFLESKSVDGVLRHYGHEKWGFIGDWLPPKRRGNKEYHITNEDRALFNNCYLAYLYQILSKSASVLGDDSLELKYIELQKRLSTKIDDLFYDDKKAVFANGGQSYLAFPLLMNIPLTANYEKVFKELEYDIQIRNEGHLDTGMLGTYFMLDLLAKSGRSDLVYLMMKQKSYPGWGYMLSKGANTCWEHWDGRWSNIHACFVSGGGWFYQGVAGIGQQENSAGFKKILIKPQLVDSIRHQNTFFISPYGKISVEWNRNNKDQLQYNIEIPVNTEAKLFLPVTREKVILESGSALGDEISIIDRTQEMIILSIPSGKYTFDIKNHTNY